MDRTNKNGFGVNFVVSTGRCGTQWLHYIFKKYYEETLTCTHEPIQNEYESRRHLGHDSVDRFLDSASDTLRDHLRFLRETSQQQDYLETGHTSWGVLKYFKKIFDGSMKVVVLTRDPITLANSWMKHGLYKKPILPHLTEKIFISPFDEGVRYPSYRDRWKSLSQFEKVLYYWLEVNSAASELIKNKDIDFIHLRYEHLFSKDAMQLLLDFLNLEFREELSQEFDNVVDQYAYYNPVDTPKQQLQNHPDVIRIAKEFGYDY